MTALVLQCLQLAQKAWVESENESIVKICFKFNAFINWSGKLFSFKFLT
jgi:hypothetical protein